MERHGLNPVYNKEWFRQDISSVISHIVLQLWRHGGIAAPEARCRYGDVEVWSRAADVGTWRHGGMEVWSSGGALYV